MSKRLTVNISDASHHVLKMTAAALDMTQAELVEHAILEKGERSNRELAASQKAFAEAIAKSKEGK